MDTKQELGRGAYGIVSIATFRGTKKLLLNLCANQFHHHSIYLPLLEKWTWLKGVVTPITSIHILTEIMDTSLRAARGSNLRKHDHVFSICLDVAQSLNYLHENNPVILHCD